MSGSEEDGSYPLMDKLSDAIDMMIEIGNGVDDAEILHWAKSEGYQLLATARAEIEELNQRVGEAFLKGKAEKSSIS